MTINIQCILQLYTSLKYNYSEVFVFADKMA